MAKRTFFLRFSCWCVAGLVAVQLLSTPVSADVFRFKDGRVIFGKLVSTAETEIDGKAENVLSILIDAGTGIRVLESELERNGHEKLSESEKEYMELVRAAPPQTAQDHYELAGKCSGLFLSDLANAHYHRALDLDPSHTQARVAAGYKKDDNGRWVKLEVIMGEQRGKVLYRGRWRFPEEVVIMQAKDQAEAEIADVKREWNALNNQAAFVRTLSTERKQEALQKLLAINDPRAVPIFSEFLMNARKPAPENVRAAYVEILSRFENSAGTLATASVVDPSPRVRNACLDALRKFGGRTAINTYLGYLGNPSNELVNRAADGLAQFNPPEAVLPLINALVTSHQVTQGGGAGMNVNANGGLAMGGGAKTVKADLENASVLATLTQITGQQSYGYDEASWLAWYASRYASPVNDLRRDP